MATHQVLSNASDGQTRAAYTETYQWVQAGNNTAATKAPVFVARRAGTVTDVFASFTCTQSSDRTVTLGLFKGSNGALTSADVALLGTEGVLSSGNTSGTFIRSIGSTGVTAHTSNTNPVLSTTAGATTLAAGDDIRLSVTLAGSNGSLGTDLVVGVEVTYELGDDTASSSLA